MTATFTFPGQGSQAVGMGKALSDAYPASKAVFEEVDEALGEKLSDLIFEGPIEALTLTENTQPALMAVSMAAVRALDSVGMTVGEHASFVAGHSLGEYSALAAAGSIGIADAAKLLRIRGKAMQDAVPVGQGAMAALIGLEPEIAKEVAAEAVQDDICQPANDNGGGQVVVSGNRAAVERAVEIAKARGAKRAVLLPVSAPFHCALMEPAAKAMAEVLAEADIRKPSVPVIANVSARPESEPETIRSNLVAQVTAMVRWRESVQWLGETGVDTFVEVGAGKVLSGLARRIVPGVTTLTVGAPENVEQVARQLAEHEVDDV